MTKTTPSTRERLLETAARLFFEHDYRAIGVDTIVAESGVGKMTLYRHFPTKDDLVVAFLRDSNEKFWAWFDEATRRADTPRDKLLAYFQSLERLVTSPTCYGCPFLNAAVDFPQREHPGHAIALEHKQAVRTRFGELAATAGTHDPAALADQLILLMDGAFMAARMFGSDSPARGVAQAAQALIDAQLEA
jgi:AcrR family transcriptional regulator